MIAVAGLALALVAAAAPPAPAGVVKGEVRAPAASREAAARVRDTVVEIRSAAGAAAAAPGEAGARVEVRHGEFVPHVLAIPSGTSVEFVNRDDHIHNVVSSSPAKKFDLGMTAAGESGRVVFDAPGVARVQCKVEPAMEGWIVVLDTPWFAVADVRGTYEVRDVPAGAYVVKAWNPHYEPVTRRVTISRDGEVLALDLRFEKERAFAGP